MGHGGEYSDPAWYPQYNKYLIGWSVHRDLKMPASRIPFKHKFLTLFAIPALLAGVITADTVSCHVSTIILTYWASIRADANPQLWAWRREQATNP